MVEGGTDGARANLQHTLRLQCKQSEDAGDR